MVFYYNNERVTNTDVGNKKWALSVTVLTLIFHGLMWKTLGFWTRKEVQISKWNLTGHPNKSLKTVVLRFQNRILANGVETVVFFVRNCVINRVPILLKDNNTVAVGVM